MANSAIKTSTQMTQMHHYQAVSIVGSDAVKTLQGQMTCDVQKLAISATTPGLLCDIRGRVQIIGWVHKASQTELWLITHVSAIGHVQARLRPYLAFSKSKATVLSLEHLVATRPGNEDPTAGCLDLGFAKLVDALAVDPREQLDLESLATAQLEAGIPELGDTTRAQYTPQALSLDQAGFISFTKGCYMGQEVIARLHYKGQAKQTLVLLHHPETTDLIDGQTIYDATGVKIGQVISGMNSKARMCLACINKRALAQTPVFDRKDWVVVKSFSPLGEPSN